MRPTGIAIKRAKLSPNTASSNVSGSRWPISSSTGRFVHSDSPRSPRTARPSHSTYCTWKGRSRPSFARSSAMSFAYEVSASMSCTASPGMRRGSVKTIAVAITSEGTATSNRRARYRLSTPASSPPASAIQPGGREPPAEIVAEVGAVVLQRALPHGDAEARMDGDVVLLGCQMALDGVDQLTTLGDVERAPLTQDQVRRDGVLDVALVARLA